MIFLENASKTVILLPFAAWLHFKPVKIIIFHSYPFANHSVFSEKGLTNGGLASVPFHVIKLLPFT